MVTIFGIPADGLILFAAALVVLVLAFVWSELRSSVTASKKLTGAQLEKARKLHSTRSSR